jgi:hypothetical protein
MNPTANGLPSYVPPAIVARQPLAATLGVASSGPVLCAHFDKERHAATGPGPGRDPACATVP